MNSKLPEQEIHARTRGTLLAWMVRNCVYGSHIPIEYLYKKRFVEHNESVIREVPPHRLGVIDITKGDSWNELCNFLGEPVPQESFPHFHNSETEMVAN